MALLAALAVPGSAVASAGGAGPPGAAPKPGGASLSTTKAHARALAKHRAAAHARALARARAVAKARAQERALARARARALARAKARAKAKARQKATPHVPLGTGDAFPVAGPHSFGGADARFGAKRTGHIHQGQDITAAVGTPVVSPHAGIVVWRAYQAGGAGRYLVVRSAAEGRDYVFMHLRTGSLLVHPGDAVARGQQLAEVGLTGDSSGPHLHFEVWVGPWQMKGGHAVDPLPFLRAWGG